MLPVRVCSTSILSDRLVRLWNAFLLSIPSTFQFVCPNLPVFSFNRHLDPYGSPTSLWLCYFRFATVCLVAVTGLYLWCVTASVFENMCTNSSDEVHSSYEHGFYRAIQSHTGSVEYRIEYREKGTTCTRYRSGPWLIVWSLCHWEKKKKEKIDCKQRAYTKCLTIY